MTEGLKRFYGEGDLHFITCSCYQRRPLLDSAEARNLFVDVLEQVRRRYRFVVVGYVVMPEHFHLLMSEPEERDPSVMMQVLKQEFAKKYLSLKRKEILVNRVPHSSRFLRRVGSNSDPAPHVWQPRFYDFNVWSERKRIEKLRYMHRNPVTRGLVASPEQWAWSSYRAYAYNEAGRVLVNELQPAGLTIRSVETGGRQKLAG